MAKAVETMTNLMDVLKKYSYDTTTDGVTILSNAVRAVSFYSDLETAVNNFVYEVTSTEVYSSTYKRLRETCGIILGADEDFTVDTGAVSGYNAGGSVVKDAQSIVPEPEGMTLTDISAPAVGTTITQTFTGDDGKVSTFYIKFIEDFNVVYDYADSVDDEQGEFIESTVKKLDITDYEGSFQRATAEQVREAIPLLAAGLYNWWLPESFKLAYDSYGLDFDGKTISIRFGVNGFFQADTICVDEDAESTPNDDIMMTLNADLFGVIDSEDQNGNTRIEGGAYQNYLDRTIAHEMIHATMFGDGILKTGMPEFFTEGVAELIMGLDDYDAKAKGKIYNFANDSSSLADAMTFDEGTGHGASYTAGYMFLRWLCHENLDTESVFGTDSVDVINYYGDNVVVNDFNADDFIMFDSTFDGLEFSNNDFTILSGEGKLLLRDVGNITVNFIDDSGTLKAKAYAESEENYSIEVFDSSESFTFGEKNFTLDKANATFNLQDGEVESITNLAGRISGLESGTYLVNGVELEVGASDKIVGTGSSAYVEHAPDGSFASQIVVGALQKTDGGTYYSELYPFPYTKVEDPPDNCFSSETWTIKSDDNLTLEAAHFSPQNPTGKWIVLTHGYGNDRRYLYGFAEDYLEQGYDVLTPDMRAAGQSEGEWLTLGTAESRDLVKWTQEIAATNKNAQITLHGPSMGAATVVMAAAREDCTNVTGIVVDCCYTNAFEAVVNEAARRGVGESVVQIIDAAAKSITGYAPSESSPIDYIPNVTEPTLFIVGANDTLTPVSMTDELYEASGAEVKDKVVFEGANHAESVFLHYEEYKTVVENFIETTTEDIGADISNTAENSLVRGTIFDDTIENSAVNATISGGEGNDTISNSADSVTIVADAGFDSISNTGDAVSVSLNDSVIKLNDQYFKGNGTLTMTNGAVETEGDVIVLDTITILESQSAIYGGVEYTAIGGDAVLSIDSETSSVTGIMSGEVTAEIADASSTPTITIDGSTAFEFTATTTSTGALKFGYQGLSIDYTSGAVTYNSNGISVAEGSVGISLLSGTIGFSLDVPASGLTATLDAQGIATLVAEDEVSVDVSGLVTGSFSLQGEVTYNMNDSTLDVKEDTALGIELTSLLGNAMDLKLDFTVTDAAGGTFKVDSSSGLTYTPAAEDGSLNFNVATSNVDFGGNLEISGGSLSVGIDGTVSLSENATFKLTTDDSTITLTTGDDPMTIEVPINTSSGEITISPTTFSLVFEDSSGKEIFNGDVSLSGGDLAYDTSSNVLALESGATISATTTDGNTFAVTASGNAEVGVEFVDGAIKITGQENDATLDVSFTTSDSIVVDANLNIAEGSGISFNPSTGEYDIDSGTKITVTDFGGESSYNVEVETPSGVSGQLTKNDAGQLQLVIEGGLDVLTDTSSVPSTDPVYEEGTYLLLKVDDASSGEARTLFDGGINVVAGTVAFTPETAELSLEKGTFVAGFIDGLPYNVRVIATDDATAKFALDGTKISVTPEDDEGNLLFMLGAEGGSDHPVYVAPVTLSATGTISYDVVTNEISLVEGSSINLETYNAFDSSADGFFFKTTAVYGNSSATFSLDETTGTLTITPATDDGALELAVGRDDVTFLSGTAKTSAGSYSITPTEDGGMNFSVSKGAEIIFEDNVRRIISVEDGLSFDVILDSSTSLVTATAVKDEVIDMTVYSLSGLELAERTFTIGEGSSVTAGRTSATGTSLLTLGGNSNISVTSDDITLKMSTEEDASVGISVDDDGNVVVTPGEDDGGLSFEFLSGTDTLLSNTVSVSGGSIILGNEGIELESGTTVAVESDFYSLGFTVSNDAGVGISIDNGEVSITPNEDDGKLLISASVLGYEFSVGELEISGGSINLNLPERHVCLTQGTTATLNIGDTYGLTATATDDATVNFSLDGTSIVLTPEDGDGSLDLALTSEGETVFSGNVEVSGGSIKYNILGGAYEIASGTTLNLTDVEALDGTYNVEMIAATDLAGVVSFSEDGPQITIEGDIEFDPDAQPDSSTLPARTYLSLKVDKDEQTIFDGDIDVMGGAVTLSRNNIALAENTRIALSTEDSPYSFSVMNTTASDFDIGISDGVVQLSFDDSDTGIVVGVELEGSPESSFSGELKGVGTFSYDFTTNEFLLLKGSELTISTHEQGYGIKLTATDDAGGGFFSVSEDGTIGFAPDDSDADLKIELVDASGTSVIDGTLSILGGSFVYTPVDETGTSNVYFGAGTDILLESESGRAIELIAEEGGSFNFDVNSETGMVMVSTVDDSALNVKYTSIVTGETYEGTLKLSGTVGLDGSEREIFMAEGTTIESTYGDYEFSITATDDASLTVDMDEEGTIYIHNGEDDGALLISFGRSGYDAYSATINLDGGISFNPSTNEVGLIAGSTAEITVGDYTIELTAPEDAAVIISRDGSEITLSTNDTEKAASFTVYDSAGTELFGGEASLNGSISFDVSTRAVTLSEGTVMGISAGDYGVEITATADAGGIFGRNADGAYTFTPGDSDGNLKIDLVDASGTSILGATISMLSGTISYTPVDEIGMQNISFSADAEILVESNLGRVLDLTSDGGGSFDFYTDSETGMVMISTADDSDLNVKYTSTVTGETYEGTLKLSGTIGLDGNEREIFVAEGTTIGATYDDYEFSITATDDASLTVDMDDEGIIYLHNGEDDGALLISVGRSGYDAYSATINLDGGISFNPSTNEVGLIAGSTAEITVGDYTIELTAPEDAAVIISRDESVITLSTDDTEKAASFTVYDSAGTELFGGEVSLNGSISFDVSTNAVTLSEGTVMGISAGDYGVEITATADAGGIFGRDEDGAYTFTPGDSDGNLKIDLVDASGTSILGATISMLSGTISYTPVDETGMQNISFSADAEILVESNLGRVLDLTSDGGGSFDFYTDSETGMVMISTADDSDLNIKYTSIVTGETYEGTLKLSGTIGFDGSEREIFVAEGTTIGATYDDYEFSITATDDASLTVDMDEEGIIYLHNGEDDGALLISVGRSGYDAYSATINLDGGISFNPSTNEVGLIAGSTAEITVGDYTIELTAPEDAAVIISRDGSEITLSTDDTEKAASFTVYDSAGTELFGGEVSLNGSISFDVSTNAVTLSEGTVMGISVGDYGVEITATADAGGIFGRNEDGAYTFTPGDSDGNLKFDLVDASGTSILGATISMLSGTISYTPVDETGMQNISFSEDAEILVESNLGRVLDLTSDGGGSFDFYTDSETGMVMISTADDSDLNIKYTSIVTGETYEGTLKLSGTVGLDGSEREIFVAEGTTIGATYDDYEFSITATDDASLTVDMDDEGIIYLHNGEDDGALLISFGRSGYDAYSATINLDGGISFNPSTNEVGLIAGSTAEITVGDYTIELTAPEDAAVIISRDGSEITLSTNDTEKAASFTVYDSAGTELFGGEASLNGSISFDVSTRAVTLSEGTVMGISAGDYGVEITATADAGGIFGRNADGAYTFTPGDSDGNLKFDLVDASGTSILGATISMLSGTISYTPVDETGMQNISFSEDAEILVESNLGRVLDLTSDGGGSFDFYTDSETGMVMISTADDSDLNIKYTSTVTGETYEGTLKLSGTIGFDGSEREIFVAEGTTIESTYDDYEFSITATDDASLTVDMDEEGIIYLHNGEDDGALLISFGRSGYDAYSATINLDGGISFNPSTNEVGLIAGSTAEITVGDYTIELTAPEDAAVIISRDGSEITLSTDDTEKAASFTVYDSTGTELFGGEASLNGSISFDVSTRAVTLSEGTVMGISAGDYGVEITATADAGGIFGRNEDGAYTFTPGDSDGNLKIDLVDASGTSILGATISMLSGTISYTPVDETGMQNISFSEDAEILVESNLGRVLDLTSDGGGSFDFYTDSETGMVMISTADDSDLNIKYTSTVTGETYEGTLKLSGTIGLDGSEREIFVAEGTTIGATYDDYEFSITATDDASLTVDMDEEGTIYLHNGEDDGALLISVGRSGYDAYSATINLDGGISFNPSTNEVGLIAGSTAEITVGDYTIELTAPEDAAVIISRDGSEITLSTDDTEKAASFTVYDSAGTELFGGEASLNGSISFDVSTRAVTLSEGTVMGISAGDYGVEITATADAGGIFGRNEDGAYTFTPGDSDGNLKFDLVDASGTSILGATISMLSGTISYTPVDETGMQNISFSEDAEILVESNLGRVLDLTSDGGGSFDFYTDSETGMVMISTADDSDLNVKYTSIVTGETYEGTLKLSGTIGLDGSEREIFVAEGTTIESTYDDYEFSITATDDASLTVDMDEEGIIYLNNGEDDGALLISFGRSGYDAYSATINLDGGISFNPSTNEVGLIAGSTAEITVGDYTIELTAPEDAAVIISRDGSEITLSTDDTEKAASFTVYDSAGTELFGGEASLNGSISFDVSTNAVTLSEGTVMGISVGDYGVEITATADAGGIFGRNEDGAYTFTPGDSDGNLKFDLVDASGTSILGATISMLSGTISYTPVDETGMQNISFSEDAEILVESNLGRVIDLTSDGGGSFDFYTDSETGMVMISTADDSDLNVKYTSIVTGETYEGTLKLSGTVGFDGSEREVFMAEGTTFESTYGDYELSITATDDASVTIDMDDEGTIYIHNGEDDGALEVTFGYGGETFFTSTLNLNGGISFNPSTHETGLIAGSTAEITVNGYTMELTAPEDAAVIISRDGTVFTLSTSDTEKTATFKIYDSAGEELFEGEVSLNGSVSFDILTNAMALSDGTTLGLSLDNYEVTLTANGDASSTFVLDGDEFTMTPGENDGSLEVTLTDGDEVIFDGEISVESGSVSFNRTTGELEFAAGTSVELTVGDYTFVTTNEEAAGGIVSFSENGVTYTPNTDDGGLAITIETSDTSVALGTLSVTNGSFTLDTENHITVSSGTSVDLTFVDGSVVNVTATDEAGGKIDLVDGGIKFTPGSDDGGLELSVTTDGETRTTSLDVTGSVTYMLGGAIELEEGTIVTNTFESGRILTITANTDASGEIRVTSGGLTITPATSDALTVAVTASNNDYSFAFDDITGSITYLNGNIVLADGTELNGEAVYRTSAAYDTNVKAEGEGTTIDFGDDYFKFTSPSDATLTLAFTFGGANLGWVIEEGSLQFGLDGSRLISEGSVISASSSGVMTLETAGTYTLNGAEITTTEDGVGVYMTNYDTISFSADAAVDLGGVTFSGDDAVVTIKDGNIVLSDGVEVSNAGDTAFVMYESGTTVIDGKTFMLVEDIEEGATVSSAENGLNVSTTDILGPFAETVSVTNDESYTITASAFGVEGVLGVSSGATIDGSAVYNGGETSTFFDIVTDSEGEFTLGDSTYTVAGDDSVTFIGGFGTETSELMVVDGLDGTISGAFENSVEINDNTVKITGDDSINVVGSDSAVVEISGVSDGATISSVGNTERVITDSEGEFVFDGGATYNISGDGSVTFEMQNGAVVNVADLSGVLTSSSNKNTVNGVAVEISDTDAEITGVVGIDDIAVGNLSDGATVGGDTENIAVFMENQTVTIGKTTYTLTNDDNTVVIQGKDIVGLDKEASLQTSQGGTYTVNGSELTAKAGDIFVGSDDGAYIFDPETSPINPGSSTDEILEKLNVNGDYGDPTTETDLTVTAEDGKAAMILDNDDRRTQIADFSETEGAKSVTLESGDQVVIFNDEETGNVAVVPEDADGEKLISFGDGKDVAVVEETAAEVAIVTGAGKDTVVTSGDDVEVIFAANDENTRVVALEGNVTFLNYDADTKSGLQANSSDIAEAIEKGDIDFGDGTVYIEEATVQVGEDLPIGETMVNIYNTDGKKRKVGFTHSEGGVIDASSETEKLVLVGNMDGTKEDPSTLIGGSNNDTIFAGAGDVIDAGDGKNLVELSENRDSADEGAMIMMNSENGKTTVDNFNFSFEDDGDAVAADIETADISFDGENVTIYEGDSKVLLTDAPKYTEAADSESDTDIGETSYTKLLIGEDKIKTAVAEKDAVIAVPDSEENTPEAYIGENSGVDFSEYNRTLNINLAEESGTVDKLDAVFRGINKVKAGSAESTLIGSAGNDTLVAGSGLSVLNGGAGNDSLVGYTGDDKKDYTTFYFSDGHDTIEGFEATTGENEYTSDVLNAGDSSVVNSSADLNGNVIIETDNGGKVQLNDMAGQDFAIYGDNQFVIAQVARKELTFDGVANYYHASSSNATVKVSSSLGDAEIWLNDYSHGNVDFDGEIIALDGSAATGATTLVGNDYDNIITAGNNGSSLWGSFDGNDTLIGGDGEDTFWYELGNGNDKVVGATEDDTVYLNGITLDMFADSTEATDSSLKLNFEDGGSVSLDTNNGTTFKTSDGASYVYNKESGSWDEK